MAKNNSAPEEEATTTVDVAAVNEPTRHEFPTQQTGAEPAKYAVATEELFFGGVRAHNVGDLVPVDNVERNGWADKVRAQ